MRRKIAKYSIAFSVMLTLTLLFIRFCYPSSFDHLSGTQIRFPEGRIIHSPHSLALSRKMWKQIAADKKDSVIRIAVVAADSSDFSLRDSVAEVLRNLFNDPRINCKWEWSKNWTALKNNFDSPFNRPSTFTNLNPDSPRHDYINGWIQCNRFGNSQKNIIRIIYKNEFPEIISTFSADSENVLQQNVFDDGNWHMLSWPMNTDSTMITIDGKESPQIGNITIEPVNGFSTWTFRIPQKLTSSSLLHYRRQVNLVPPRFLILATRKNNFQIEKSIAVCKKIFDTSLVLVFSEEEDHAIAECALTNGCAYISGEKFPQMNFWKLALQNDIRGCFH